MSGLFHLLGGLLLCGGLASPAAMDAQKWREDLHAMADNMPRRHKNLFHTMTQAQFEAAVAGLDERIPSLQRHQIIVEMARIAAMVGDGHTNVAPTRDTKIAFRTYPIQLYFFRDGLYVRSASPEHAKIVGARVVRIGRATVDEAYGAVREIIGRDNEMDVKYFAPFLLAMPEVLHALGLIEDMERAPFTVERAGERTVDVLRPAGLAELLAPDTDTSWVPRPGWTDARDAAAPVPLWLRDPRNKYWFEYLLDSRTVYAQFNHVGNKDTETIEAFADRLFRFVDKNEVDRLVLDLRLNRGGNGGLNRPLLLGLIRATKIDQKGKLFVLIGRSTWSAAQMLVNELEQYTNAIFVGEPSGGKVNSYGDSRKITLPQSGITVRVSSLWWQVDERDSRPWKAPDVAADLTFDDYRASRDPALDAAIRYAPTAPIEARLMAAVSATDVMAAADTYAAWRGDPRNAYLDPELALNELGYGLIQMGRLPEAIQILRIAAEASPLSANAHDSLGEAYAIHGDRTLAIQSYERALTLDPRMESAREALQKLRAPE